eukprot:GDKI01038680.1.p2 GENE.GDKI01038680.1~~GDKI01038680.1.p2  ORF type:complete len:144 (-),score=46.88 GDKI01038680.1:303-734(-)
MRAVRFDKITLKTGVEQVLWPEHCVAHSVGAAFHPLLERAKDDIVVTKGLQKETDSYSGFGAGPEDTGLRRILKERGVEKVYVCGLATDFCVGNTALDAKKSGFATYFVEDASRGVSEGGMKSMLERLKDAGVVCVQSKDVVA